MDLLRRVADFESRRKVREERLGWQLDAPTARAMSDYLRRKPKGAHGEHRYTLESMGLEAAAERRRFGFYRERFRVPEE